MTRQGLWPLHGRPIQPSGRTLHDTQNQSIPLKQKYGTESQIVARSQDELSVNNNTTLRKLQWVGHVAKKLCNNRPQTRIFQ